VRGAPARRAQRAVCSPPGGPRRTLTSGFCATFQAVSARVRGTRVNGEAKRMNENFSLIVMCFFLLASLAFLAEQLTSYH